MTWAGSQSFDDIHKAYRDRILRYTARLVCESEAEDLTQEVFVRISKALGTFRGDSQLSTWIYRIATNVAMDRLRSPDIRYMDRAKPHDLHEYDDEERYSRSGEKISLIDQQLIRKEMNYCIREVIEKLPEIYRTVIVLSQLEELTNCEIAEVLQVSVDTVKIRLHRARERLKKDLEGHCTFYRDERNEFACDRRTIPLNFLSK